MQIEKEKIRLDKYLAIKFPEISRTKMQKAIKSGRVLVNGEKAKASQIVTKEDKVKVEIKEEKKVAKKVKIDIKVLLEEKEYLVIEKPAGIVVHPSETNDQKATIVNSIIEKVDKGVGEESRPGIVHRLDKDTSGALIIAKTKNAYVYFVKQFKERKIKKKYMALVKGNLKHKQGIIDSPISRDVRSRKKMALVTKKEGKRAITKYRVKKEYKEDTLLELEIETGRTHQIRVHMAGIGHPVVGDNVYGITSYNKRFREKFELKRQFLHAEKLEFIDPDGKKKKIISNLPLDLKNVLARL